VHYEESPGGRVVAQLPESSSAICECRYSQRRARQIPEESCGGLHVFDSKGNLTGIFRGRYRAHRDEQERVVITSETSYSAPMPN
jgi:hypothetical protein